ncbi:NEW3 domain-containing protein [Methanofollis fontis]|uniref:Alpha-1,6-galactosidase n=1 Tax=Methanofollis fontis TaxID=2052832 RepID=A0A483CWD3_9EURY|nr:NEW3 domain-containing protein [Methanofollis fontis]TAJ45490.1 alpha-1,6-galactosidase [Methanofollis fontis]
MTRVFALLAALLVLTAALPLPAAAGSISSGSVSVHCDFPGQVVEAGETATFSLTATNNGAPADGSADQIRMWTENYAGSRNWEMRFVDGETEVNRVSIPAGGSKVVTLEVETAADTPVGEYPLKAHIGDGTIWLHVTISKTHTGELGTLNLLVTDKDGERVKGATVEVYSGSESEPFDRVMTTADGRISTGLPQDVYLLLITKPGYRSAEKRDVKVKCGITTDAGTVMLEKSSYAAEVTVKSSLITTPAGRNPTFEMTLQNVGKADDTYRLSTGDLPAGWYARYKENAGDTSDISEIFVPAGGERSLYLEAIPPYGTEVGDYSFTAAIESSSDVYTEDLTAKISGSYEMRISAERYRYEADMGESVTFDLQIRNIGNAGALTGIRFEVNAPQGWKATVTPANITSLQPGESERVSVTVVPPSSIVASEYKITVNTISDQGELSDDFRIVVREQSFAAIAGLLLLGAIAGGVWYYFRKYQRR